MYREGAIISDSSIINIRGGTISSNKGRHGFAIMLDNSTMTMSAGSITNNTGTSVGSVVGTFTHTGGTISGNKPK